jgi:hypothetical protein
VDFAWNRRGADRREIASGVRAAQNRHSTFTVGTTLARRPEERFSGTSAFADSSARRAVDVAGVNTSVGTGGADTAYSLMVTCSGGAAVEPAVFTYIQDLGG